MKLSHLLTAGAFAASLALPIAASAQQSPQPPYYPPQQQPMQQPGAPLQRGHQNQTTPSIYKIQAQYLRTFATLGITSQQQTQITGLINQFGQTHPEGSPRDHRGMKELRQEILSVLTPQQQQQYEQIRKNKEAQRAQMRQQRMQQPAQGPQGQPQYGSPVPPQPQQQPVPPNA